MNTRRSSVIAGMLLVALVLLAGLALGKMGDPSSYEGCGRFDRAIAALESERTMTRSPAATTALETRIAEIRQQAIDAECAPTSKPTETATAEPTDTPSDEPTAEPTGAPSTPPGDEELTFPHFFFFDQGKIGARDFGPPITGGNEEWQYRLSLDPSLLCTTVVKVNEKLSETGDNLVSLPGGNMLDCTKTLAADQTLHDAIHDELNEKMDDAENTPKDPGVVNSTYMVDVDDVPASYDILDVHRPELYEVGVVKLSNGLTIEIRWLCGGQIQEDVSITPTPTETTPVTETPTTPVTPPTTETPTTPVTPPTTETPTTPVTPPTTETPTTPVTPPPTETIEPCPPHEDGTVPEKNEDGTCPKDPAKDPQEQGNIPDQVGDGDDTLPTAEGCVNGGIRNRDGVCELPGEPAVPAPEPTATYTPPAPPAPQPAPSVTPPAPSAPPPPPPAPSAPSPEQPETGGDTPEETREEADANGGEDNPFGSTEDG